MSDIEALMDQFPDLTPKDVHMCAHYAEKGAGRSARDFAEYFQMSVEFAKTFPFPKEAIMPVILRRVNSFPHPEWYNQTDFISLVRIQTSDALRGLQESGWKVLEWEQEFHGKYLKYCPDCNSHLPEEKITHNSQEKGGGLQWKVRPGRNRPTLYPMR